MKSSIFLLSSQGQARPFGLALGGGVVRGFAHIGVLQALADHGLNPAMVAGTSAGAVVAALYAFGITPEAIYDRAKTLNWLVLSRPTLSRLGLVSNEAIKSIVKEFCGDPNIQDAPTPLAIVATDIGTGEEVVLRHGNLATALMASTCLPGIFKPVHHQGRMLVDGGLVNNVPVGPLRSMGARCVVGVNVNPLQQYRQPKHVVDVLLNMYDIATNAVTLNRLKEADLLIEPDVATYNRFDFKKLSALYTAGYRAGQLAGPRLEELLQPPNRWYRHLLRS